MNKTNAMRILDKLKIEYKIIEYDTADGLIDGMNVAEKTGLSPSRLCKTLVCRGKEGYYVYILPVSASLDLKAAAHAANEKKIEMLPQKDLKTLTGYVHGGCSPLGMKKAFPTYLDTSVKEHESISVSGGAIGIQILLSPSDLQRSVDAQFAVLTQK